ncbi:nitrogen fixation NifU-like protein [Mycoplasma testudineum]|uniref:Nitrogen fixation NifU-like protein n=1 Tax=Mycoplasma testudineum TaxID=244584 RepID=A0A4R6IDV7_9MOLU|nr:iron-sulfur cluster assembly scaffold protein [Mycoplasma testudineum]TDO19797.1 nitrogen fixation NifU-like protein [Mycoplasma testudineum]
MNTKVIDLNVRRKIVMENYRKCDIYNDTLKSENSDYLHSNTCADAFYINIKINNERIESTHLNHNGCAIFKASSCMYLSMIQKMTISELKIFNDNYKQLISGKKYDEKLMKDLYVFDNVKEHLNRITCASLISEYIDNFLEINNDDLNG